MTIALAGYNTILKLESTATPGTYGAVAGVVNIQGPGLSADVLDATQMDSTGGFREKIPGLKDGGDVSLEIHYVPDNAAHSDAADGLVALYAAKTTKSWQIVWPDSSPTTFQFDAFISAFQPGAPVDGKLTASVTLSVTGQPDFSV